MTDLAAIAARHGERHWCMASSQAEDDDLFGGYFPAAGGRLCDAATAAAEAERLRAVVRQASRMGLCSQTHHEHLLVEARAALDGDRS